MTDNVPTINGDKQIGRYDKATKTYSKWARNSHRLWKAGGAYTIDRKYLDETYPDCLYVEIYNVDTEKSYRASVGHIRRLNWKDSQGRFHESQWGEQYALPFMYWRIV